MRESLREPAKEHGEKALGADTSISKSEVSRICADLDTEVSVFRDRSLADQQFPYVFLDATYCKARVNRRVVSQAVVIATGIRADGWREVLAYAVGDSEDGAFWTAFLRSLKARGLGGVQLVISDAHTGLKQAISAVPIGAAWQWCAGCTSCATSWPRSPRARRRWWPRRSARSSPSPRPRCDQLGVIAGMLGRQSPKVETMLRDAGEDLLAFTDFPPGTGKRSGPRIRWSGWTRRSSGAPTWSGCPPTPRRCYASPARCWSRPRASHGPSYTTRRDVISRGRQPYTQTTRERTAPGAEDRAGRPPASPARPGLAQRPAPVAAATARRVRRRRSRQR